MNSINLERISRNEAISKLFNHPGNLLSKPRELKKVLDKRTGNHYSNKVNGRYRYNLEKLNSFSNGKLEDMLMEVDFVVEVGVRNSYFK